MGLKSLRIEYKYFKMHSNCYNVSGLCNLSFSWQSHIVVCLFLPAYFQDLKRKKYLLIHYGNCYNHISANFYI